MSVDVDRYVDYLLGALDSFVSENIEELTGEDLSRFYSKILSKLKEKYFGGSWGFEGITEFLILRVLHYIGREKYGEEPEIVPITKDLRGFYFLKAGGRGLVLSAGRPLVVDSNSSKKRMWPDILVYEPENERCPERISRIKSAIEVKAYPQRGYKGIAETLERFENIKNSAFGGEVSLALIIYDYPVKNKKQSKIWRYLMRGGVKGYKPIPEDIDVLVLSAIKEKVKDLLWKYI
jgi:hypothetical protein